MIRFITALLIILVCTSTTTSCLTAEKPVLEYQVRPATQKDVKPKVVILLHGYGSDEKDLFSLTQYFPDNFLVISARAPFNNNSGGYAWFQIDYAQKNRIPNLEQEEKSKMLILEFIKQMKTTYGFDSTQLYLGGFSQGGIMSYNIGLSYPQQVKGIFVLSGILVPEAKTSITTADKLKGLQIFISHGTSDPVLSITQARESVEYIKELGLTPQYKEYPAVHTITSDMLADLLNWLNK